MSLIERLGAVLDRERGRVGSWKLAFFGFLGLLLLLNVFIRPDHPHVYLEHFPWFWAGFGLAGAAAIIALAKKYLTHLIGVDEDYYDRDR
jgi:drug/metabolite transporter (DMT)-like permease